jgi:acyl-coenzyme A synthetase/AMP-(fatty) acid ligase
MLTLFTSGSTEEPKHVNHSWEFINECARASIKEIGLTPNDRVIDVYPANTIAHYTVTGYPTQLSGASLISANFNPFTYCNLFKEIQPTYISLIPRHLELLNATKDFKKLDMSCVRYMVTGTSKIEQSFIDSFREKGVQCVANWYGMTENPPPVLVGYNSESFDINSIDKSKFDVKFKPIVTSSNIAECVINGKPTGDLFDLETMKFEKRIKNANGSTWKTKP